jgi:outer membrane protein OmpA-like peptidoglycan-associated protein
LLSFLFSFPFLLCAQNLLMNGSFEEENICMEYEKNCAPEGWISTSLYADYFFDDSVNAFDDRHFTGLIIARSDRPQLRNFLRSRLLCGLRKGAQYRLQFYIRSRHNVLDSVGIYFSAKDFLYQKDRIANSSPQLFVKADSTLRRSEAWQKVNLLYTASGDENFINIGDFKRRGHDFKNGRPDLNQGYYLFLDKISLVALNANEKICDNAEETREDEYAFNPRHDKLDRLIYTYTKNPPPVEPLSKTVVQRIDTLVIPDVLFATASYALNATANTVLDSFLRTAAQVRVDSVVVEGHTDNQGSLVSNQKLSENRAVSVAGYLQRHLRSNIFTRGWASQRPAAENRTPAGRQKNRRVEIYFYVRE